MIGDMHTTHDLQIFRKRLYDLFPKLKDSTINLIDAISSYGHTANSVVQLSKADSFDRQYSSITAAISKGLPHANFKKIRKLIYDCARENSSKKPHRFIVDCTPHPRPYAKKLQDRHITHCPNQAPGNKPICVGHQYSVLMMLPENELERSKRWLIPLTAQRVKSDQKGNEVGMQQIVDSIDELQLEDDLCVSIGDSLYGTERCRITAKGQDNLVHIFRISNNRNLYCKPDNQDCKAPSKGRKKAFGQKMNLGKASTHPPHDNEDEFSYINSKGKKCTVKIKGWDNMLLRGSREYNSSKHPMNLIQVQILNENMENVHKRPLWLCVFGSKRHQISSIEAYKNYKSRYDIEHFFRFGKQKLLLTSYQTPEIKHEELWWQLCLIAYAQLYLGKDMIANSPEPWERYLPEYKNSLNEQTNMINASQAQKGFADILEIIDTPAKPSIVRGKESGRVLGDTQIARDSVGIIFKSKASVKKQVKKIITTSENETNSSNLKKITSIIELVQKLLKKVNITSLDFSNLLLNST
jgi:hypothetical protein